MSVFYYSLRLKRIHPVISQEDGVDLEPQIATATRIYSGDAAYSRTTNTPYSMSAGTTSPSLATSQDQSGRRRVERWFYPGIATLMLVTAIAGFVPAALSPAGRHGPLSLLAGIHGAVFFSWLLLFVIQTLLIKSKRLKWHRRLGVASVFGLACMVRSDTKPLLRWSGVATI